MVVTLQNHSGIHNSTYRLLLLEQGGGGLIEVGRLRLGRSWTRGEPSANSNPAQTTKLNIHLLLGLPAGQGFIVLTLLLGFHALVEKGGGRGYTPSGQIGVPGGAHTDSLGQPLQVHGCVGSTKLFAPLHLLACFCWEH